MAKLVSKTYGEALFSLALEEKKLDTMAAQVETMRGILNENEELQKVLNHPKVSKEEKIKLVETIFKGRISDDLVGLLVLTVEKDRHNEISAILDYFLDEVREYKNIGIACVTSAVPLTEEQKRKIEDRLLETTKYVRFRMEYAVDKSLYGGLVVRVGDRVVDSSIRTQIGAMARELSSIQLAE